MKKKGKVLSIFLCFCCAVSCFNINSFSETARAEDTFTLQNPRIEENVSDTILKRITWDFIQDDTLYEQLQKAEGWDENGDNVIDGEKYRRLKKSDMTYNTVTNAYYYNWGDEEYHYFKYQPIGWLVLETGDGKALLQSDLIIDDQKYHEEREDVTWAASTIRSWLNGYGTLQNQLGMDYRDSNFIDTAFSEEEQQAIQVSELENENNANYDTNGGENTEDRIFLLAESDTSEEKGEKFGYNADPNVEDGARSKKSSTYAKAMGLWYGIDSNYAAKSWWWLRTPGSSFKMLCMFLVEDGLIHMGIM